MRRYELRFVKKGRRGVKILRAKDLSTALSCIIDEKLNILSIKELSSKKKFPIKNDHLSLFFKQFSFFLAMGLSIEESLKQLGKTRIKTLKKLSFELQSHLHLGRRLSEGFEDSFFRFHLSELALIKMTENTGSLSHILLQLSLLRAKLAKNKEHLKKIGRYPLLVLIALAFGFFLFINFLLPQFSDLFHSLSIPLPPITRFLLSLHGFFSGLFFPLFFFFIGLFFLHFFALNLPRYVLLIDRFCLRLPVLGRLLLCHYYGHFFMSFSLLLQNGLEPAKALELALSGVDSPFLRARLLRVLFHLKKGKSVGFSFRRGWGFESLVLILLDRSEGRLASVSLELSHLYTRDQDELFERIFFYLQPLVTLLVGGGVLLLVLSIVLPLWSLSV